MYLCRNCLSWCLTILTASTSSQSITVLKREIWTYELKPLSAGASFLWSFLKIRGWVSGAVQKVVWVVWVRSSVTGLLIICPHKRNSSFLFVCLMKVKLEKLLKLLKSQKKYRNAVNRTMLKLPLGFLEVKLYLPLGVSI